MVKRSIQYSKIMSRSTNIAEGYQLQDQKYLVSEARGSKVKAIDVNTPYMTTK